MQNELRGSTQIKDKTIPLVKIDPAAFADLFVDKEDHSSACNSVTVTFNTVHNFVSGSEHIYLKGLLRDSDEYTVVLDGTSTYGIAVTFNDAPINGDSLRISYRRYY